MPGRWSPHTRREIGDDLAASLVGVCERMVAVQEASRAANLCPCCGQRRVTLETCAGCGVPVDPDAACPVCAELRFRKRNAPPQS